MNDPKSKADRRGNASRAGAPRVKIQAQGKVLNPGDPGYEEAHACAVARAESEKRKQENR